jgi:hypothetical protein
MVRSTKSKSVRGPSAPIPQNVAERHFLPNAHNIAECFCRNLAIRKLGSGQVKNELSVVSIEQIRIEIPL